MKASKLWILIFFGAILLNSCSSDDDQGINPENPDQPSNPEQPIPSDGPYADGFFVTNEGQFPNPGSISFISNDLESAEQHIFETVNGEDAGSVVQSMFFDDQDRAYIISNNSNMISVVDRNTFEKIAVIDEGLELPRYGVVVDGKAYVTNQAPDNYVAVINLENLSVENTIDLNGLPAEYIKKGDNGMLYVQNASFNMGNNISVIDPGSNAVVNTIETEEGLSSIALDHNTLYALSADEIEKFDFTGNSTGQIELNYEAAPSHLAVDNNEIYFTIGKEVYVMNVDDTSAPSSALFSYSSDSDWGVMYGFAVKDSQIYIADGGDFASDSFVEIHDADGSLLKKVDVGIGPNGFFFN